MIKETSTTTTTKESIKKSERIRINDEIKLIIRDINAVILGIMEHGNSVIQLNKCAAFIVTYLAECDHYYSGRTKGGRLPRTLENFERLLEKLIELHTSTVPAMNDPERILVEDDDEESEEWEYPE